MWAASNLPRPGTGPAFYGKSQSSKEALGPGGSPAAAGARRGLGGLFVTRLRTQPLDAAS